MCEHVFLDMGEREREWESDWEDAIGLHTTSETLLLWTFILPDKC